MYRRLSSVNYKIKFSASVLLLLFAFSLVNFPSNAVNTIQNPLSEPDQKLNSSSGFPDRSSSLTINNWANLSSEAALWLENKADKVEGYSWDSGAGIYYMDKEQGAAGIGQLFVKLYELTKDDDYLDAASEIGDWYYSKSSELLAPGKWSQFNESYAQNYTGLDNGAAGVGEFFYELYEITDNTTILDLAQDVTYYIESLGVDSGDQTKYPKVESLIITDEEKTFDYNEITYGTSSGSLSNLAANDGSYYTLSSESAALSEKNEYDSNNYEVVSLTDNTLYSYDALYVSQQFAFNSYPISFDNGIDVMAYKDEDNSGCGLIAGIFEAQSSGLPNMSSQVGDWSDTVSESVMSTSIGNNITFDWTGANPELNGTSENGYCLVISVAATPELQSDEAFYVVFTNDTAYANGKSSYKKTTWNLPSSRRSVVFDITDSANNYVLDDFKLNLTDYGLVPGFDVNYIEEISIKTGVFTSTSVDYSIVSIYDDSTKKYVKFGDITNSELEITLEITNDINDFIDGDYGTINVRFSTGDISSSHSVNIDYLNISLTYSDEYYGFDLSTGVSGIGEFFLKAYEITHNTSYLTDAERIGNYLISEAKVNVVSSLTTAAWENEDGDYYTSLSTGVAGIGSYLLHLGMSNASNAIFRTYAEYAGNWLISYSESTPVFDYLDVSLGVGTYWSRINSSSSIYNGYMTGVAGIADFLLELGLSVSLEDETNQFIAASKSAANFLISSTDSIGTTTSVIQNAYTFIWSDQAYPMGSVDISYESGTAGIITFLNNIYMATHNTNYSKYVSGAYEYLRMNINDDPVTTGKFWNFSQWSVGDTVPRSYGFYSGVAGVALSLLEIEFTSRNSIDAAQSGLDWLYSQRHEIASDEIVFYESQSSTTYYSGLGRGTAGVGMAFLDLFKATGDSNYFDYASYCAQSIEDVSGWGINNENPSDISFGMSDGLAGIGMFYIDLVKSSSDPQYLTSLENIASYIIDNAQSTGDQVYWYNSSDDSTAYYGWDFGTAGIIYFLTDAYELLKNETYLDYAESAARWLDANDDDGIWELSLLLGGDGYNGFSDGASGIGYSLLNLYRTTKNSTYLDLINNIYQSLVNQIDDGAIPVDDGFSSDIYSGLENGQAGIIKFFADFYDLNKSSDVYSESLMLVNEWLVSNQESNGAYDVRIGDSSTYNSYSNGITGIISGTIDSYSVCFDYASSSANLLEVVDTSATYLIGVQDNSGYWDDNSDTSVYYGYYNGIAGIADQLLKVPDLNGPSLSIQTNISLETENVQYKDYLEVNITSFDVSSGIEQVIIAYQIDDEDLQETSLEYVGNNIYRTVLSPEDYNTTMLYYIVAIDGSGIINIDDNNSQFYSYTYQDLTDPTLGTPTTYDSLGVADNIQYDTGGRIVVSVDEPSGSSGIKNVSITYNNVDDIEHGPITAEMSVIPESTDSYRISLPGTGYEYGDQFVYYITATDNAGNVASSETYTTTIGDNILPILNYKDIQDSPKIPAYTKVSFRIGGVDSAESGDPIGSGIDKIFLNYTIDGGTTWDVFQLVYNPSTGYFEGDFGGKSMNTEVQYMICIQDKAGNIAYYDSQDNRYTSPIISGILLYKYDVVINWIITLSIIGGIAALSVLGFYLYTKKTDYWDRMRHQAGAAARAISIQERLTNIYYSIVGFLVSVGDWILSKIQRPPGTPNPVKEWYDEKLGDVPKKILGMIGNGFKALIKFVGYSILSPFYLIASIVKNTGFKRVMVTALLSLCMIIFSVIKYIGEGVYPMRALFFINFGMILFIGAFVVLIFHIVYKISYK